MAFGPEELIPMHIQPMTEHLCRAWHGAWASMATMAPEATC